MHQLLIYFIIISTLFLFIYINNTLYYINISYESNLAVVYIVNTAIVLYSFI